MPPVNDFWPVGTPPDAQLWMPTDVYYCHDCTLVQLGYEGRREVVFPRHYPYTSGITKVLRDNFADLQQEMQQLLHMTQNDHVIDIGSNDGTLLKTFSQFGNHVLGIEPTDIAYLARSAGIQTMNAFFSAETARMIRQAWFSNIERSRTMVTCSNCFAHMPNLPDIMEGILLLIQNEGVFVSESTYWVDTLDHLAYDTIYHEHLRYYTLTSIRNLFEYYGLDVFHVKHIPTAGGAIRVYAAKRGKYPIKASVPSWLEYEKKAELPFKMSSFAGEVRLSKLQLLERVSALRKSGARIAGISAPSRAGTVISYCRLELDYIAELPTSLKMGKYMPGTSIPVVEEDILFGDKQPEAAILFSWHIADELIPKLRQKGFKGEIILPCARSDHA
jgi:hypothetical protein